MLGPELFIFILGKGLTYLGVGGRGKRDLCYGRKFAFKFTFILTLNLVTSLYRLYNKERVM